MGFFDDFDRFYATSETSPYPHRLNSRHDAIFKRNLERFNGKRVLDIASHDGRWSFAALQAGATHVVGIEPRQELINNAIQTFTHYGTDPSRFSFLRGDIFERIKGQKFDTVLCLGFYYHTLRHAELLDLIERTGTQFIVIDTEVTPTVDERPAKESTDPRIVYGNHYDIQLIRDPVDDQQMAWEDSMTRDGYTLVGRPSRAAVSFMANHFGFSCETYDWPAHFRSNPVTRSSMVDYDEGWRDTFYLARR